MYRKQPWHGVVTLPETVYVSLPRRIAPAKQMSRTHPRKHIAVYFFVNPQVGEKLTLKFRKYFRDPLKRMHQGYLRKALDQHRYRPTHGGCTPGNPDDDAPQPPLPPPPAAAVGSGGAAAAQESSEQQLHLREGVVDSVKESSADAEVDVAFVSGLFSQEEDIRAVAKLGLDVRTEEGLTGHLKGPFGKLGKCKVEFARGRDGPLRAGQRVFAPR